MRRIIGILLGASLLISGCGAFRRAPEKAGEQDKTAEASIAAAETGGNDQRGKGDPGKEFSESPDQIIYEQDGAFLYYMDQIAAGPYQFIESVHNSEYDPASGRRFIADNGLIGYMSFDGSEIICEPVFTEAEELETYGTRVSEGDGYYYIDDDGTRITRNYKDGSPHFEHQGSYCRVMLEDGSWGVIDSKDNLLFSGYEMINPLPDVSICGSGIKKDGTAAIFYLGEVLQIDPPERVLEGMTGIGEFDLTYDAYAVVTAADGRKGLVDGHGEIVLPPEYSEVEIQWYQRMDKDKSYPLQYLVKCHKEDGSWEVFLNP